MTTYYWESLNSSGAFHAKNDKEAKLIKCKLQALLTTSNPLLICYKESDTKNGLPFMEI